MGAQKNPSHWDGSFEYPQHMFWLRNKKKYFSVNHFNERPGVHNQKLTFIFLDQNVCLRHSEEPTILLTQRDDPFEHPKLMLKLMAKKI